MSESEKTERFEALFHETYPLIVAYCRRRCASFHDAEEAVAATYLVAWRRMDEVEAADSSLAWLYAVAYRSLSNVIRGQLRLGALRQRLSGTVGARPNQPDLEVGDRLEVDRAFDSLGRLAAYDQELIRLAAFEDLSYAEIAQVVGKSEDAVRSDLYRARRRLRAHFNDEGGRESGRIR